MTPLTPRPRIRKAVFPVAGLGTRFLPATKAVPKEMLPLVDKPLIQYAVDEARAAGIEQFIFVSAPGKEALVRHFDHAPLQEKQLRDACRTREANALAAARLRDGVLSVVHQSTPLGLGHAVWCARHLIGDEPFAVLLPDDVIDAPTPCLEQMIDAHQRFGGNMVAVETVEGIRISTYGCLNVAQTAGRVVTASGIVEKPAADEAPSNLGVVGRYLLQPSVLDRLGRIGTGSGGETQLTDALAADLAGCALFGYRFRGERFDCGSKLGFLEATIALALGRPDLSTDVTEILARRGNRPSRAA